jgi:hypothetical protein
MFLLKLSFIIGTVADAVVAANWYLIAFGVELPNMLAGYIGSGENYQFAMYIAALFMTGWTVILFWGYFKPEERKGLLIITAGLLFLSIIMELLFFSDILGGSGFTMGIIARVLLITKFSFSYFYSIRN